MPNYSTKKSSILLFQIIALCLLLLVEHASGNISIPQQDIQPVFDPELVPEIRLDETMAPSSVPTSSPSMIPTTQPSFSEPSTKEAPFRQEFTVGSGLGYISDDIHVLKTLFQRYTNEYLSPIPETEIVSKIQVTCTVDEQETHFLADGKTLVVDYKMKYSSQHYDVTLYPLLFQNWTNSNLDTVLEQVQLLGLNVTTVGSTKRVLEATGVPTVSTSAPSVQPTMQPSLVELSTKEAPFRQEFTVGSGLGYISDDILLLGALYQRYTSEYLSPIPETEIVSKIDVICDVKELDIHLLADGETLIVDYKMKYVSQHYDVSLYPLLFQNWTNSNLDTVLEQMQSLGLNVTAVGTVKRILIATREPTVAPSMAPTAIPIPTMEGYSDITDTIIDAPGSRIDLPEEPLDFSISVHPAPESSWTNEPWSNFGVIIIVISSIMGICILTVGLNIYIERKKNPPGYNFDTNIGKRAIWNDPRRRETSITDVEAFHPDGSPSARNNGESIIIDY